MSLEEIRSCDMSECRGGKYVLRHGCGHDVCSLCVVTVASLNEAGEMVEELNVCPECFAKASKRDE